MSLGDYKRIVLGHKYKEYKEDVRYRNILGGLLRTDPRKLYYLPGDYNNVPEQMTQEEMKAQAIKLGYAHLLGIGGEA